MLDTLIIEPTVAQVESFQIREATNCLLGRRY